MEHLSVLPETARHVLLVVNPKAGAGNRRGIVDRLIKLLQNQTWLVDVVSDVATLPDLVRQIGVEKVRAVVAGGGDGTIGLVANLAPPETPLAILPLGTENLVAKHFGVRADPERLAETISKANVLRLDAGSANGRLFLLMVGCGLDAEVVRRLHETRTGHIRRWSYVKPILSSIRHYSYPRMRVHCGAPGDSDPQAVDCRFAFVVNLPRYACGLNFAPRATGVDGRLDLCTFSRGSFWHGMRYLGPLVFGRHESLADCTARQATELRIEADEPVPFQIDGDPGGMLPVEIRVLPGRLRMLV